MTYNTTYLGGATGFIGVADGVNNMTGGLYASLVLLVIFIVFFIASKKYDSEVSFLISSFATSIVAVFFFIMNWISVEILIIPIVLLLIAIFYSAATK